MQTPKANVSQMRVGIMIIGSLLWDNNEREQWRTQRLDMDAAMLISVPIRYGRLSTGKKRYGQYTMTFSCSAGAGVAYVVPCRKPVRNAEDLFEEAGALALAEGFDNAHEWPSWGAVGLLVRDSDAASDISILWSKHFNERADAARAVQRTCASEEAPQIDNHGFLRVGWPQELEHGEPVAFDLLLATANEPSIARGQYAGPAEIAESLVETAHKADYFCANVLSGIRTFEDLQIWGALKRLNPAWLNDEKYHGLQQALTGGL
jgi:hypothetical protein